MLNDAMMVVGRSGEKKEEAAAASRRRRCIERLVLWTAGTIRAEQGPCSCSCHS